ncbi:thioesterase II family protein [Lysinibacillus fusiformis]|uniref:thioesterase II family protein n=1 Tax=Lysinibacillus fusiformis TaxID=28031 RepID=UPI0037FAE9C4
MILFCLPYAGGTAGDYLRWKAYLNDHIEVLPIEYPGHGQRLTEPLCRDFPTLHDYCLKSISEMIRPGKEFSILGHSLGGILAYELTVSLQKINIFSSHLFVSASFPPNMVENQKVLINSENFNDVLMGFQELDMEIINSPEFIKYYLPILQADYQVYNSFKYREHKLLNCPITTLSGIKDSVTPYTPFWELFTSETYSNYLFKGDHFYIKSLPVRLFQTINDAL